MAHAFELHLGAFDADPVAVELVGPVEGEVGPRAPEGGVEVDPGVKRAPFGVVEGDAVVAFAEELDERGGVGGVFAGVEEVVVALGARAADVGVEVVIGAGEGAGAAGVEAVAVGEDGGGEAGEVGAAAPEVLLAVEALARPVGVGGLVVVAADAAAVEDGLDLAHEAPGGAGGIGRREGGGGAGEGRDVVDGVGAFVAAGAGDVLAGLADEPGAHELECLAAGVERLEGEGDVGGRGEEDRAVGVDGDGAEEVLHVPARLGADAFVGADLVVGVVIGEDAQGLDGAARDAGEAGAVVDVGDVDGAGARAGPDEVGEDGRDGAALDADGLAEGRALYLGQRDEVVEDVHQIDAPEVVLGRAHGDEEELARVATPRAGGEREGREEAGPVAGVEVVLDALGDGLAEAGDHLDGAGLLGAPLGDVEEGEAAGFGGVVPGGDADEAAGLSGDGLGVAVVVGPEAVGAVVGQLAGAVGAHGHDVAAEEVR